MLAEITATINNENSDSLFQWSGIISYPEVREIWFLNVAAATWRTSAFHVKSNATDLNCGE